MKIWYNIPYAIDGNYGKACNDFCKLVPEEDWVAIVDGDFMFLNKAWGHQFQKLVEVNPDAGLITTLVNRVGNLEQCYEGKISEQRDVSYHRNLSIKLQEENYLKVKKLDKFISGHFMLFSKKTWQEIGGFPEELSEKGKRKFNTNIATVDNRFSHRILKAGKSILLAEGVYAFHYYRLNEGISYKDHLGYTGNQVNYSEKDIESGK